MLRFIFIAIALAAPIYAQQTEAPPPDSPAVHQQILDRMRAYADGYVSNLPNFLCDQVTRQYDAGKHSKHWHNGDTLLAKLSFHDGQEERHLDQVDGKPVASRRRPWRAPLVTEGEFGILLNRVLGPQSEAVFTWRGWDTLHGKRVAVFDFVVDRQHSTLTLHLSDLAKAVIPYNGSVYGDPDTGTVLRISDGSSEIPAALDTREISTTIDYDNVSINGKNYLLPVAATVLLVRDNGKIRNEIEFQNYRKFETGSVIHFGSGSDAPPPPKQ